MMIDMQDEILRLHSLGLLELLLKDKTTGGNIRWATDAYRNLGPDYGREKEIRSDLMTGVHSGVITNRAGKAPAQQTERTRQHAEVFTPLWICRRMTEVADEGWFPENARPFDRQAPVTFPGDTAWRSYVDSRCLEITCGEAPYLASRYDVSTGERCPMENRVGLLDRKLRVVKENTPDEAEWMKWVLRAFQSVYGYEFQGDNVLIARMNLLMSFEEYFEDRLGRKPAREEYLKIIDVIVWNIWQMDGLTGIVPYCRAPEENYQYSIFDCFSDQEQALDQGEENHPYCRIFDWKRDKSLEFLKINKGSEREMKFDFVIGNPPYQDETIGENKTFAPPVYHKFLDAAYQIADRVEMIHPARFLFNAGSTPKKWNQKMLSDPHLKVLWYEPESSKVFSNTEIKGGVIVTYYSKNSNFGSIKTFTSYPELNAVMKKVVQHHGFKKFSSIVFSAYVYKLTEKLHAEHPEVSGLLSKGHAFDLKSNIFERLPHIFVDKKPNDGFDYNQVIGRQSNKRVYKYIRSDYINKVKNLYKYKIYLPSVYGKGSLGEVMPSPILSTPAVGTTETFISIGCFDTQQESEAALKYIATKFVRILLSILKVTQHITPESWAYVPLQDFTSTSDIDWSKSIPDIDRQLYVKYRLDEKEVAFIESHVKEMI